MISIRRVCALLVLSALVRGQPPAPSGLTTFGGATTLGPGGVASQSSLPSNSPLITIGGYSTFYGGNVYAANAAGAYDLGYETLSQGSQINYRGTTVSLAPGGRSIVINGQTSQITQGGGNGCPIFVPATTCDGPASQAQTTATITSSPTSSGPLSSSTGTDAAYTSAGEAPLSTTSSTGSTSLASSSNSAGSTSALASAGGAGSSTPSTTIAGSTTNAGRPATAFASAAEATADTSDAGISRPRGRLVVGMLGMAAFAMIMMAQ